MRYFGFVPAARLDQPVPLAELLRVRLDVNSRVISRLSYRRFKQQHVQSIIKKMRVG